MNSAQVAAMAIAAAALTRTSATFLSGARLAGLAELSTGALVVRRSPGLLTLCWTTAGEGASAGRLARGVVARPGLRDGGGSQVARSPPSSLANTAMGIVPLRGRRWLVGGGAGAGSTASIGREGSSTEGMGTVIAAASGRFGRGTLRAARRSGASKA